MKLGCSFPECDCVCICRVVERQRAAPSVAKVKNIQVSWRMARDWDNKPCPYCAELMHSQDPGREPTWDHICPTSRGGAKAKFNKVAACRACNASKADKLLSEWLAELDAAKDVRAGCVAKFMLKHNPHQENVEAA